MIQAAGILFIANDEVLLLRRSAEGDHAGEWSFPGGKLEEGETADAAAVRECQEELGGCPAGTRVLFARRVDDAVDFTTFLQRCQEKFKPALNDEHDGFMWAKIGEWPGPLHPGCKVALDKLTMDELGIARAMAAGDLTSPQHYLNISLFSIRITGTGTAFRKEHNEFVYRAPENYLTQEFLQRCQGLPVIIDHPDGDQLDTKEFEKRIAGTILLPFIYQNEVWGIAKIYDQRAALFMEHVPASTSPAVVFRDPSVNEVQQLEDGKTIFIEGKPSLLDHIAICDNGVWDKGGPPTGVASSTVADQVERNAAEKTADKPKQENNMDDDMTAADQARKDADELAAFRAEKDARKDSEGEKLDKLLSYCDSISARMDALESSPKPEDGVKIAEGGAGGTVQPQAPETTTKESAGADEVLQKEGSKVMGKEQTMGVAADADTTTGMASDEETERRVKEEMAERADLKVRMDALDKKFDSMQPPDEMEMEKFADAQARHDSVMAMHGQRAPRPLAGETLLGYRKRLLQSLKQHSPAWKNVDLRGLAAPVLDIAEPQIRADAEKAAKHPVVDGVGGTMREVKREDVTGRKISEFFGGTPSAGWMGQFRSPVRRVTGFDERKGA